MSSTIRPILGSGGAGGGGDGDIEGEDAVAVARRLNRFEFPKSCGERLLRIVNDLQLTEQLTLAVRDPGEQSHSDSVEFPMSIHQCPGRT